MFSIKYLIITVIFVVTESKPFRPDYTYYQTIDGWLKLHVPGTWHEAQLRCDLEGAVLASPVNEDMRASLRSEMNKFSRSRIHTGVHCIFSKGYFYSLEGEPLSNMSVPWLPGEPDNVDDGEDCVAYGDDGVADVNCSAVLPFACYKRSSPNMTVKSCGTTDTEYEYSSKTLSCYKFHKIKRTWAEAFKICSAEGGYLAIINSAEEASVLTEINLSHRHQASIWSGFYDWKKDGAWRTVHGQTLEEAGYAHWETGQPENKEKYCGSMYPVNDHLYNYVCTRELSFVCELDPNSF